MRLEEFYLEFNKIVANHISVENTTIKLNKLLESIKGTEIEGDIKIDVDDLVKDLEEQRLKALEVTEDVVDDYEEQDHSYYDEYIDSYYESSYDSSY